MAFDFGFGTGVFGVDVWEWRGSVPPVFIVSASLSGCIRIRVGSRGHLQQTTRSYLYYILVMMVLTWSTGSEGYDQKLDLKDTRGLLG